MRLARGNRDRPAVRWPRLCVAAAVDTAVVAKVVVASEEATQGIHWSQSAFGNHGKFARRGVALCARDCARTPRAHRGIRGINSFDENLGRAGFEPAKA